jgi:hypothetical protein
MIEETLEQKLKRHEDALVACMAEITKLREENARLRSEADAHTVLRSIYSDPDAPQTNRIKAAAASLAHEKPKLMPERAPLDLTAEEVVPLAELVEQRRKRADELQAEMQNIQVSPSGIVRVLSHKPGGNGSDDTGG